MLLVLLLLLLLRVTVEAAGPIEFNACTSDVDCEPSNAICFDGRGPTAQRRCLCQWGYLWDPANHRCEWSSAYTGHTQVTVTRLSALYYSEQLNDTNVGTLQYTRGRAVLPDQWFCDPLTQFCAARNLQLGIHVVNFNYSLVANTTSNTTGVPGIYQYWRCTNTSTTRPTLFNANMIMNATAVAQGYGQRPLWEYCPPCPTWCVHGTCSTDNTTCVCESGWFGERCDQQTALVGVGQWNSHRACTFANESTACGVSELCYIDAHLTNLAGGVAVGRCWCRMGFIPNTAVPQGCVATGMASTPSVLVDFVPNSDAASALYFNGTYATAFPQYVWVQDATTLYAVLTSATTKPVDPAWRINSSLRLLERCLQASDFIFRPEYATTTAAGSVIVAATGRHRWCGTGGCVGVCGAQATCPLTATQAFLGTCGCGNANFTGRYCDTCVGDRTGPACNQSRATCRASSCAGHGDCVDAQPIGTCRCDRPFLADTQCAVSARVCGQATCSGHGECIDTRSQQCVCDTDWKGAACNVTAAACRTQRCAGAGSCATDTQGCTCDPFQMLSNCSATYCAYNQPRAATVGQCLCNASFTGTHCQTRKCGMYGDATGPGGACVCYGVMRLSTNVSHTGVCTGHICGARGYPVAGTWCTCYAGSRLVQSDPVCQCQKACSVHTLRYNATTDTCVCVSGYTGEFCQFLINSKRSVPRDWTIVITFIMTAVFVLITMVGTLQPHFQMDQYHTKS